MVAGNRSREQIASKVVMYNKQPKGFVEHVFVDLSDSDLTPTHVIKQFRQ